MMLPKALFFAAAADTKHSTTIDAHAGGPAAADMMEVLLLL